MIVALLAPPALALGTTQASADSISIVQTDPTAVAGQAVNFTASGDVTSSDLFGFDVYLFVKDPDLDPTCAADSTTEEASAMSSQGHEAWVSPATGFYVGTGGTYSVPFRFTFSGAGPYLFCGYLNSDFSTVASGQLRGTATAAQSTPTPQPSPSPTPSPQPGPSTHPTTHVPVLVHRPAITRRRHVLICSRGRWSRSPSSVSYRWYVRGRARSIASGRRLVERRSLQGRHVRCRVTARNAAGARSVFTRSVKVR